MDALAHFIGGKIFLQRLLFEALHTPKKIQLIGCANIQVIGRKGRASVERGNGARESLASDACVALNAGEKSCALNTILRARLLDAQCSDPEVAIILQRDLDQPLQPGVVEEFAPINVGGNSIGRIRLRCTDGPRTAHRRGWPIVFGHHRATAQQHAQAQ